MMFCQKYTIFFVDQISIDLLDFIDKEPFSPIIISQKRINAALLPKRTFFAAEKLKRERYLENAKQNIDIFITVTDHNNIKYVEQCFFKYGKKVNICVAENRGRNITGFFCYNQQHYQKYDLIAHIHTKKSPHIAKTASDSWRHFLFAHLIDSNIIDSIITLFSQNSQLGLLFPDDPFLTGWSSTANKKIASQLIQKIDPNYKIPNYIEFPVGTMFWSRYEAIRPLFELKLKHDDFPDEPMQIDGTLAHAIERIIPLVCESQGFSWETLKRSGIERNVARCIQDQESKDKFKS